ncbi:MAG: hypothetical protein WCP35_13685 [Verrucomicrobiota bacterium]
MSHDSTLLAALIAVTAVVAAPAPASASTIATTTATATTSTTTTTEVAYELHTKYSNEYLFRGLNYGHGLVEVGADASAELRGVGLSAGVWYGSFQNNAVPGLGSPHQDAIELDLYGQVSKNFRWCTGSLGYIYRYFEANDHNSLNSQEVVFSLSHQFWGVDTSLTYFWGVEQASDGYSELALGKGFELCRSLILNGEVALGYLAERGQLTALTSKLSLDWSVTSTATVSPFVKWSIALSDDNDSAYRGSKNQLVGGIILAVAF